MLENETTRTEVGWMLPWHLAKCSLPQNACAVGPANVTPVAMATAEQTGDVMHHISADQLNSVHTDPIYGLYVGGEHRQGKAGTTEINCHETISFPCRFSFNALC